MSGKEIKLTDDLKAQTNEPANMLVKSYLLKNPQHLTTLLAVGEKVHSFINKPEHLAVLKSIGEKVHGFLNNPEYIAIARNITIQMQEINKTLSDPNVQKAFKLFLSFLKKEGWQF